MSDDIKVGDKVMIHDGDNLEVKRIDTEVYEEPIAFFVGGGFWRVSQLRKVN